MLTQDKPKIRVKSRNIQLLIDYCLENKVEFTVVPVNANSDDWDVEVSVKSIAKAIELGMFMKSNRLELAGAELFGKTVMAPKPVVKPRKPAGTPSDEENAPDENNLNLPATEKPKEAPGNLLSFD